MTRKYFESAEYKHQVELFNRHFLEWLGEMEDNKPAFAPYHKMSWDNAFDLVKGVNTKGDKSFRSLDVENCKLVKEECDKSPNDKLHNALIKLFAKSIDNVINAQGIFK